MPNDLVDALANVQEQEALALTQQLLDRGTDPAEILTNVRGGMDIVGKRCEDGDYTPRLEALAELPRGKVCAWIDVVDIRKMKSTLGNAMCFVGNVPLELLILGTPQDLKGYVTVLIETLGDNSGLIINGAASGVPEEAKAANVRAVTEAVSQHGVQA